MPYRLFSHRKISVYKLPVIFLSENNRYGMGTAFERVAAVTEVGEHACSYDMAAELVNGMDVLARRVASYTARTSMPFTRRRGGPPSAPARAATRPCSKFGPTGSWATRCPTRCTACTAPRKK